MKKIVMLIIILCFSSLVSAAPPHKLIGSTYPPVPDSMNSSPLIIHLVCHYIENLPDKPENNEELLKEYIKAYKHLKKAVTAPVSFHDDHATESHEEKHPSKEHAEEHGEPDHSHSSGH